LCTVSAVITTPVEPIGNDFAGPSIRIETGGELVPGLK
jgi:hypothetical protein